ncbi:hypothetical protein NEAUS06_1422 [Nematocida ausubeli]|nr:hypothetical protein NEAUS06_1422 [Nematocida ausubeli]
MAIGDYALSRGNVSTIISGRLKNMICHTHIGQITELLKCIMESDYWTFISEIVL